MADIGGWVRHEDVRRFLEYVSLWIGYDFGPLDWQTVETALLTTDAEREDGWYDHPLLGEPPLVVWIAQNVGDGVVSVRVVGAVDAVLAARIETAIDLL